MLLIISMSAIPQKIIPYFGVEYLIDYSYTYIKPLDFGNLNDLRVVNDKIPDKPMFNVIAGFQFNLIKSLSLDFKFQVLTAHKKNLTFQPMQTEYSITVKYQMKSILIKYEHMCLHPIKYSNQIYFEMYGGYDKIGLYWNFDGLY